MRLGRKDPKEIQDLFEQRDLCHSTCLDFGNRDYNLRHVVVISVVNSIHCVRGSLTTIEFAKTMIMHIKQQSHNPCQVAKQRFTVLH